MLNCASNPQKLYIKAAHPDIYLRPPVLSSLEHLGCSVGWGAAPGVQMTYRRPEVGEPEVGNLDVHLRVQ